MDFSYQEFPRTTVPDVLVTRIKEISSSGLFAKPNLFRFADTPGKLHLGTKFSRLTDLKRNVLIGIQTKDGDHE